MSLSVITAATAYPVTLAEAKLHCRVDVTVDDSLIDGLIAAATSYVEDYTGRALMAQTLRLSIDGLSDSIKLPRGPVQSITSVKYDDATGTEITLAATYYTADLVNDPQWLVRNTGYVWPTVLDAVNAVRITYVAGYASLPAAIKQAVLLLISAWYDTRSHSSDKPVAEVPHAVTALLANHRAYGF